MKNKIRNMPKIIFGILKLVGYLLILILSISVFLALPIAFEKVILFLQEKNNTLTNIDSGYIEFYGTILSGLFTLVGVVMTIKYESRVKREDDLVAYKPILSVDGINLPVNCKVREVGLSMGFLSLNSDPKKEKKQEKFYKQLKENNPKYRLIIKNKGRAETFNTVLESYEVVSANWNDEINLYSNYGGHQYVGEILKDEYFGIDVNLPNYLFMPEKMQGILWYELRTDTFITYSDMFNKIKYQYRIHTVYKVIIDEYQVEQPYFYRNDFKYAKVHYEIESIMPENRIYSEKLKEYVHEQKYIKEKYRNI